MDACCRIELFGGLRVLQQGRVITRFQTRQTAAVLAYLSLYRERPQPRDLLMEVAWPAAAGITDRHKLRVALTSLRRQLEPPGVPAGAVIFSDRHTVQLNPETVSTDVAEFEAAVQAARAGRGEAERAQRLAAAAALYRGELLPGLFESWIVPERHRLAQVHLQILDQLIEWTEQAGDRPGAVEYARKAVAADPLREESHQQLIRLLAAAGRPEAARQQYQELERLLAREFGEAPGAATQTLVEAIEQHANLARTVGRRSVFGARRSVWGSDPNIEHRIPNTERRTPNTERRTPPEAPLPAGTLTFLLVEFEEAPDAVWEALRPLFRGYGGREVPGPGGVVVVAFGRASEAVAAALAGMAQASPPTSSLPREGQLIAGPEPSDMPNPTRELPRMALDTGEVEPGDPPQHSPALEHGIRLLLAAHPGQILLSDKSAALLRHGLVPGVRLVDRGHYYLGPGLPPDRLFQVEATEGPCRVLLPPRAMAADSGRLPLRLTRFFGRETEIKRLCALLSPTAHPLSLIPHPARLITLTGAGGSGKTRLAQELMAALRDTFQGAVWFVPLADLSDPGLIPDKVREVLDLPRLAAAQPLEQVVEFLSSSRFAGAHSLLLVLDNIEQLLPGAAAVLGTLLGREARLCLLVTSRQRLDLPGEREFPLAPLPVPDASRQTPDAGGDEATPLAAPAPHGWRLAAPPSDLAAGAWRLATLTACPSVQLFLDRAQAVRPDFQITPQNAAAVAALCTRLEGLPLAIELAAARAQVLTPAQMLSGLEDRFTLLTRRRPGGVPRHQSLWAALAGSYALLSPPLQRFFARLSVFRGGWTAAAAEVVCEEPAARDYLTQLRCYSLVLLEERGTEMRFWLLETLREFGAEQLSPEEQQALARRHAEYYRDLTETAESELRRPEQFAWFERLQAEMENLREALRWAIDASGSRPLPDGGVDAIPSAEPGTDSPPEIGLRLAAALSYFWEVRGYAAEGYGWLERMLALDEQGSSAARACALFGAALLANAQGHPDTLRRFQESLELFRRRGDRSGAAHVLGWIGSSPVLTERGGFGHTTTLLEESAAACREVGNDAGLAFVLMKLGNTAWATSDSDRALVLLGESLALYRRLGDRRGMAVALGETGYVRMWRAEYECAETLFDEMLRLHQQVDDRPGIAHALWHLGNAARARGDYARAVRLLEESLSLRRIGHEKPGIADSLSALAQALTCLGQYQRARTLLEESRALTCEIGHRSGVAWVTGRLAAIVAMQGDDAAALSLFEESLALARETNEKRGIAAALSGLGRLAGRRGELGVARRFFTESLSLRRELGDRKDLAECLEGLAAALAAAEARRAARWLGAAAAAREALRAPLPPPFREEHDRCAAVALEVLGQTEFAAAWAAGSAQVLEQVVAEVLEGDPLS